MYLLRGSLLSCQLVSSLPIQMPTSDSSSLTAIPVPLCVEKPSSPQGTRTFPTVRTDRRYSLRFQTQFSNDKGCVMLHPPVWFQAGSWSRRPIAIHPLSLILEKATNDGGQPANPPVLKEKNIKEKAKADQQGKLRDPTERKGKDIISPRRNQKASIR